MSINGESTGICEPCSSDIGFCATCEYTDYQCTSCLDGYSLRGIKCISDVRIVFVVLLDTTIIAFIPLINGFKRAFMNTLGPPYAGNP